MKFELKLDKWSQAIRVAILVFMFALIQYLVIQQAIGFGWRLAIQSITQPQIERTGEYPVLTDAIEASSLATLMDSRHTD